MEFPFLANSKTHIQGHRGARGFLPENTIASCCEAVRRGAQGIEIDICISADSQVVVSHEPWFSTKICSDATGKPLDTEGGGFLKIPYSEIRKIDCGMRGNARFPTQIPQKAYKPLLSELISAVEHYCIENQLVKPFWNIEIKSHFLYYRKYVPTPQKFVAILKRDIQENCPILSAERCYFSSFDPRVLRVLRHEMPDYALGFLVENPFGLSINLQRLGFVPTIFSPYFQFISPQMIRKAHRKNIKIVAWTVNNTTHQSRLKDWGIDGIITDFP